MAEGLPTIQGRAITQPGNISNAGLADRQASDMYGRVAQAAVQIGNALKPAEIKRGQDDALRDFNEADKFARDIGADSVGQVTKRSGFMGLETAGDVAYNNMMETLYLQRTERDLEAKAKELASNPDTFGDIDAFDKGFLEWFQGYSTNIETDFADEIVFRAERVRELSRNSIAQQVQANNIAEAKATMDADLASMKESILADMLAGGLAAQDRPDVQEKLQKYANELQIKANNPLYNYSQRELERDLKAFQTDVLGTGLTQEVKDVFTTEGYAAALQQSDDIVASLGLPPDQTASLRNTLRQEINLMQQNKNALEAEQRAALQAMEDEREAYGEEADRAVTDALNQGLPMEEVSRRLEIARNLVSPERYSTLSGKVYDPERNLKMPDTAFTGFQLMAERGEIALDQIMGLPGSAAQREDLIGRVQRYDDEAMKRGRDTIKSLFAKADYTVNLDKAEGARLRAAEQEAYNELADSVSAAQTDGKRLRPAEIVDMAREIAARRGQYGLIAETSRYIKVSSTNGAIKPEAVSAARTQLKDDVEAGRITREEAREELAKIKLVEEGMSYGR